MSEPSTPFDLLAWLRGDGPNLEPARFGETAERLHGYAEERFRRAGGTARAAALACRRGCDHCCHLPVEASLPEIVRIARHLAVHLSAAGKRALRERLAASSAGGTDRACPLLVDGECSVYALRPLACRGFNSTDADACRIAREASGTAASIPSDPRLRALYLGVAGAAVRRLAGEGWRAARPLAAALVEITAGDPDGDPGAWLARQRDPPKPA